jgi:hypothetical protein
MKYTYEDYFYFIERNPDSFSLSEERDENGLLEGFSLGTQHISDTSYINLFDRFIDAEKAFGTGNTKWDHIAHLLEKGEPVVFPEGFFDDVKTYDEALMKIMRSRRIIIDPDIIFHTNKKGEME